MNYEYLEAQNIILGYKSRVFFVNEKSLRITKFVVSKNQFQFEDLNHWPFEKL